MGQKVNPNSQRLKINTKWKSRWFSDKNYAKELIADVKLRRMLKVELKGAMVSDVYIDRDANQVTVDIKAARPGVIIGRGGEGSKKIKTLIEKETGAKAKVNIIEERKPDLNAENIAQNVASQLEKRFPFRRAIKQAVERAEEAGVKGVKVLVSGRLNGADIARSEKAEYGTIPLSHFNSVIDFAQQEALTTYGIIGIKVWVYTGKVSQDLETEENKDK